MATIGAIGSPPPEAATLVNFNQVWKYDQSGLEPGTAWRTNDFDDSSWQSGPGMLGFENTSPYPYPISVRTPLTVSDTVTSYYFRTTFQFTGLTNDLTLIASNFVDDGCVIYLNGMEAGRVRITNGYNAATYAQSLANEGRLDAVTISNLSLLRQGENQLAVEVHQPFVGSSDVLWGMKLVMVPPVIPPDPPTPPFITSQPQSQTVLVGEPVTFTVGVAASGLPVFYQWQKDEIKILNATGASFSLASAATTSAGRYRVIVINSLGSVTSSVANLTVIADLVGPKMVSAIVTNASLIFLAWSEPLTSTGGSAARDPKSFLLTLIETGETVAITQAFYSPSIGTALLVNTNDPNWIIGADYVLTVSNVKDVRGNSIIPGSRIAVSWPATTELLAANQLWSFHNSASLEPDVAERDWFSINFVESAFWTLGRGVFHADTNYLPCFGAVGTNIVYQPEPILFRTTFERPDVLGFSASLSMRLIADDGAILYLNGQEIYRTNMAPRGWPLDSSSRALSDRDICTPVTISLTNFLSGTNWLAAAIYDSHGTNDGSVHFGLELTSFYYRTPELPVVVEPAPLLRFTRLPYPDYRLVMDWAGNGFALEGTDTFSNNQSYPHGPWIQATNMANPYTNSSTTRFRFYRLKK